MGGKPKQSQRTKNNARPSSSGRSAELLNNAASLDPSLLAGGSNMMSALFPTLAAPALEQGLTPEFSICIKKLNKKDPITKAKALQELSELVGNSSIDDVVTALPSWAYFYKIVAVDTDCKVREAAQVCQGAFANACGRRLAPQLRQLVPVWLQAQHDDYAPACAQATKSLKATFPENKLPEVISFCKAEVVAQLLDSLVGNAEKTLVKRAEEGEERELQLQRLVTSSLQGLRYLARKLPAKHHNWLWNALAPLFNAASFWKYASHPSHHLRAAWFAAMSRVIERFANTFAQKFGARLVKVLLAVMATNDPQQQVWGCLLQYMDSVPDWHKHLNKKDLLTIRILDLLEKGGWGDAKQLLHTLLPLLENLPQDMLTKYFCEAFFNAFFKGLENKNVLNSKTECQFWVVCLVECITYLSTQQNDYIVEIITAVHRTWLETILSTKRDDRVKTNLIIHSATSMATLVYYWQNLTKDANGKMIDQLIRNIWQNFCSTILSHIENAAVGDVAQIIDGHILLLQTLKTVFIKTHYLDELVEKVCCGYLEYVARTDAEAVLTPLLSVLQVFDRPGLYEALARHFGATGSLGLYEALLRPWLARDSTCCRPVVEIAFLLLQHLQPDEQDKLMDSFDQLGPSAVEWCLSLALCPSHGHAAAPAARRWLRGRTASAALAGLARRLLRQRCPRASTLLLVGLSTDAQGEMLISEETASSIAEEVSGALCSYLEAPMEGEGLELESAAAVAAQLASGLAPHPPAASPRLATNLLQLLLHVPRGDERLGVATWCEVRSATLDALTALPPAARAGPDAPAALLPRRLRTFVNKVSFTEIEHMTSLCPYLLSGPADGGAEAAELLKLLLAGGRQWDARMETLALRYDCVAGRLSCPLDDADDVIRAVVADADRDAPLELTEAQLVQHVNELMYFALCLKNLLLRLPADDTEPEYCGRCGKLLADDYIQMEFCKLLREIMIIHSLADAYRFWAHHNIITETRAKLEAIVREIIEKTSEEDWRRVSARLGALAAARGGYWALARARHARPAPAPPALSGNGFFHCLQADNYWRPGGEAPGARLQAGSALAARSLHAAFADARADAAFAEDVLAAAASGRHPLDPFIDFYHRHPSIMLVERDITSLSWRAVVVESSMLEWARTSLDASSAWDAPAHCWDFATVTLCAALANIARAVTRCNTTKVAMLVRATLNLYTFVNEFVESVPAECERRQPEPHVAALPAEWRDVFAPALNRDLFTLAHALLDTSSTAMSSNLAAVLCSVAAAVRSADWSLVAAAQRGAGAALALDALMRRAVAALAAPLPAPVHALAHALLRALAKPCADHDAEQLAQWSVEASAQRPPLAPDWFHTPLRAALTGLGAALADCSESDELQSPATDAARGALLLADALHEVTLRARASLVHHYAQMYRDGRYVELLLPVALQLLPEELLHAALEPGDRAELPPRYKDAFLRVPQLPDDDVGGRRAVGGLACRGVFVAVAGAGGAGARGWWGAAGRAGRLLARLVAAYVSPVLVRKQLSHLHNHRHDFDDGTQVRIHWAAREAVAEVAAEERRAELRVAFGAEYPLTLPRVRAPRPAVPTGWIAMYLAYQHGTVLHAIRMWTAAISSRVESAAKCYVCYCRLQPGTGHLPSVLCHQCRNRFHTACLHKWFVSSQRSNCPLCRSSF